MPRPRKHAPLKVLLNNQLVGRLTKDSTGAISFQYDGAWLTRVDSFPVSLSLPLRDDAFRGDPVVAVFENVLPDSDVLRRRVAERVGARGTDAYSLLSEIGRDCVGALQFLPEDDTSVYDTSRLDGKVVTEDEIEELLKNLSRAPLGLDREQDFRISVAGAQEKTALLFHDDKWWKPNGTTPTTHIIKTQIGTLQNGINLSHSVENEYYCLQLVSAFGLPVNKAEIKIFGKTKALVVERFDRKRRTDGHLLRVPQEDFCQALSCPPSRKYQSEGGPGMIEILTKLRSADTPAEDQKKFVKAQIVYWLLGATDGHAKNFSVFIGKGGSFRLAPFYDVLSAQPSVDTRQIECKQMKLAMFVGNNRHYKIDDIEGRHFIQTVERARLDRSVATTSLQEVFDTAGKAMEQVVTQLPADFPEEIHRSVRAGVKSRLGKTRL